jgi:hypothetical protein
LNTVGKGIKKTVGRVSDTVGQIGSQIGQGIKNTADKTIGRGLSSMMPKQPVQASIVANQPVEAQPGINPIPRQQKGVLPFNFPPNLLEESVPPPFQSYSSTYPPAQEEYTLNPSNGGNQARAGLRDSNNNFVNPGETFAPYSTDYASSTGPYAGKYFITSSPPSRPPDEPHGSVPYYVNFDPALKIDPHHPDLQSPVTQGLNYYTGRNSMSENMLGSPTRTHENINNARGEDLENYIKTLPNYPGRTGDYPGRKVFKLKPQSTTTPEVSMNNGVKSKVTQRTPGTINGKLT